jgi:hypothetical protein
MNYDTIIRLLRWFIVPSDANNKINDKSTKLRTKGNNPTSLILRDFYMTFSISALVLTEESNFKPDCEAGGLIWVEV